jgi:hypothetical protein
VERGEPAFDASAVLVSAPSVLASARLRLAAEGAAGICASPSWAVLRDSSFQPGS